MKLIYIGRVSYLMSDAASIRVHNIGAALRAQGHQIDYICQEGTVPDGKIVQNGSTCYGVFSDKTKKISIFLEWFLGNRAVKCLKAILKKERYDGVILYNVPCTTAKKVLRLCRKHGTAVINDVTEWYELGRSKGLAAYTYAWLVDRRIRFVDSKCDGVIAISSYLENYYKGKTSIINIPPVFEEEGRKNTSKNALPRFLYAGSPSKKDELYNFLEAIKEINNGEIRVEMTLIGAPIPDDSNQLAIKGIHYFPRMPHESILTALGEHDFTVLLRREARYAKAGYSTKVAESLYYGTPVFCNEIGGADTDIQDGFNGVKISSADTETIKNEILRIIRMSPEEILEMKKNAFGFGQSKYSLISYAENLSEFMTGIVKKSAVERSDIR